MRKLDSKEITAVSGGIYAVCQCIAEDGANIELWIPDDRCMTYCCALDGVYAYVILYANEDENTESDFFEFC